MRSLRCALIAVLLAVVAPHPAGAEDWDNLRVPPRSDGPIEVGIGFQLFNITDVDEIEETVDFEGGLYLRWKDARLAYDPADSGIAPGEWVPGDYSRVPRRMYQGVFEVLEMFGGWRPHLVVSNGDGDREVTSIGVGVYPDGTVVYAEIFHCTVETRMDLRMYPFDKQSIRIYLHPFLYERSDVVLVPAGEMLGSWQRDRGIAGWSKGKVTFEERAVDYALMNDVKVFSEVVVTVNITRRPKHLLVSLILPLLILVSLTWCVFWLDKESVTDRINISFIGILSVVAYYFVMLDKVPQVAYLTMMDAFMITTFVILAATVVVSLIVERLNRYERVHLGDRVDRVSRWLFPVGYVTAVGLIVVVFLMMN